MKVISNIVSIVSICLISPICKVWSIETCFSYSIHYPSDSDKLTKKHYEYVDISSDSCVWDFSRAIETGASHVMRWSNIGDSVLVKHELGSQYTYIVKDDCILLKAYENPLAELRGKISQFLSKENIRQRKISVPYLFQGNYCKNTNILCEGILSITKSDYGKLILPDDTIQNAIRVTQRIDGTMKVTGGTLLYNNDTISEDIPLKHIAIVDKWYSPNYKYELAENISDRYFFYGELIQYTSNTFLCPPAEQEYSSENFEFANKQNKQRSRQSELREYNTNAIDLTNNICINYNENSIGIWIDTKSILKNRELFDISGILCDQLGRVWKTFSENNVTDDIWETEIISKEFPKGEYILFFSIGEESISKKLIIK